MRLEKEVSEEARKLQTRGYLNDHRAYDAARVVQMQDKEANN